MDRIDKSYVDSFHDKLSENLKEYYSWVKSHIESENSAEEIRSILFSSDVGKYYASVCMVCLDSIKDSCNKQEIEELFQIIEKKLKYIDSI